MSGAFYYLPFYYLINLFPHNEVSKTQLEKSHHQVVI